MKCQKSKFNLRPGIHYLNCAYKSPLLKSAERASYEALIKGRNPVDIAIDDFFSEAEETRMYFAELVHSKAQNIALIPSSSYGFSSVLKNVPPKKDGNAITIAEEFPSGYFSLQRWSETNNQDMIIVQPNIDNKNIGRNWNNNIVEAINERTSVVLISSIHWMTGLKFDLQKIGKKCNEVGAIFIVDGSQSVGALPIDVNKFHIDALICASYKWLFGPYSLAIAHIGDKFSNGIPLEESWMNRVNAKDFSRLTDYNEEYLPKSRRYNVGETSNFILMPILKEGLKQILAWEVKNIQEYCMELAIPLLESLKAHHFNIVDEEYLCYHLFSFQLPSKINPATFLRELKDKGVILSSRGDHVRVSINTFNDARDIVALTKAIQVSF